MTSTRSISVALASLTLLASPELDAQRPKQGIGYDPAKLVESVRGKVGLF